MHFLALLSLFAAGTHAAAVQSVDSIPDGMELSETRWEVEVRPGEKVHLNGTIESVYAQLLQLNPNYESDNAEQIAARLAQLDDDTAQLQRTTKRDHSECIQVESWGPANKRDIVEGIRYLWAVGGRAEIAPGTCGRVSCSWGSGISWCSYRTTWWTSPSGYPWIGHAANVVVQDCQYKAYDGPGMWVHGRRYHDSDVAVVVKGKELNC